VVIPYKTYKTAKRPVVARPAMKLTRTRQVAVAAR
jgi:hypothetical protein